MSAIAERLAAGRRFAASKKAEHRESQRANLACNVNKALHAENTKLRNEIEILRAQLLQETNQNTSTIHEIIDDLQKHIYDKNSEYNDKTLSLALEIKATSAKAYKILSEALAFPSENVIEKKV